MTAPLALLKQRDMTAMARIKALIEANRNPIIRSQDDFDDWMNEPKTSLFKRRAAEVLHTMRVMRLIAVDRGGNPGWEVARQMPRMDEFMSLARASKFPGAEHQERTAA